MSSSTFVPPSPLLRRAARPAFRSPRVALQANLNQQQPEHLARLLLMKKNVVERLHTLQSSSSPSDSETSPQSSSKESHGHNESSPPPSPSSSPSLSSTPFQTSPSQIATPSTALSQRNPVVIIRHDVHLPWKSKRYIPLIQPPIETHLPHINIFIEGGGKPPVQVTPTNQFISSLTPISSPFVDLILSGLNEKQRDAVIADTSRACLVLAGPGSGKTRVLTHRIAYLVKACRAPPSSILAVTFTNKAAAEMKDRVETLLNEHSEHEDDVTKSHLTIGTFHWVCARFLRMHGDHIGISNDFDICDTQDARSLISRILNASRGDGETVDSGQVSMSSALISKLKNGKEEELRQRMPRFIDKLIRLRDEYTKQLRSMNMLDFDDLLVETHRMLRECPDICSLLQNRFQHVLVDEWQDTNNVQFDIVSLLTAQRRNLFVVGDVDQSIYKFRGADSGNMQRYTKIFKDAKQIMLIQNYRSTRSIISAAQEVIEQDRNRPKKDMITDNQTGEKVTVVSVPDGRMEAQLIVSSILSMKRNNDISSFSDCAIMYRTNAQSRLLEEACVQSRIPYLLQSGTRFFERKEIKDVLAYLKVLHNPSDDNAILRIINIPPRGIGKVTVDRIALFAQTVGKSVYQTIIDMMTDPSIASEASIRPSDLKRVLSFHELIRQLATETNRIQSVPSTEINNSNVGIILSTIISMIEYEDYLQIAKAGDKENKIRDRVDNVDELVRGASKFNDVSSFLERVTLMTDAGVKKDGEEEKDTGDGAIWLTTLHGSKGLEFPAVFIAGAEDGIIPFLRDGTVESVEEERRLLYVGMTRAKRFLTITWRSHRISRRGEDTVTKKLRMSRFLTKVSGLKTREIQRGLKKIMKNGR